MFPSIVRRGWLKNLEDNEPARKAFTVGKWNRFRVVAIGDSIKTWVNGVPAADLVDSMTLTGFIGLQVHRIKNFSQKDEGKKVCWRNIRIKDLGHHKWEPLFDGKSLKGWHTLPGGKWQVKKGMIVGTSPKSDKRHGILISDKRYGDFTARVKYKALIGNSGFYCRTDKVDSVVGVNGFQAEIDADKTKDIGGLYETGGRAWTVRVGEDLIKKYYKRHEWNQMTVSAHGRRIVVHLNNRKTAELYDEKGRLEGHFGLQLHGGADMNVMFESIDILVPDKN